MEQDRPGLKHRNRFAAGTVINNGRHAAVWADGQELGLELVTPPNVDRDHVIGQPALLQHDGDLPAVRGWPVVEVNHGPPRRLGPRAPAAWKSAISAAE